ncbi:glycosyltransferase 87 family protein [Kitasatospora terrestris]|uniref:Glycosyltransferase 87 family protein n=1 Tax=Kitasatospora terrestris TaxID=258051 RepID=A0ABP9DJ42_9ACTN
MRIAPTTTAGRITTLAAAVTATAVVLAVIPGHRGWFDVGVYYGTVHHWQQTGAIYDYLRPGTVYGFTYPPFAAFCMLPMLLLGWHPAVAVSVALSTVATALLLYWTVDPIARRQGWNRWYAFGLSACLCALLNPVRDTVSFGQVNLLLVALVLADWKLAQGRWSRCAGIGIGLAAAFKLTPALFIGYLLLTRRRAAGVALLVAVAATAVGHLAAPRESGAFWTRALWDTDRVGAFGYISNQSLQGGIARLGPELPGRAIWLASSLVVLAVWAYRVRLAHRAGDRLAGYALTGTACCLVSPITWVHHLVWLLPALVVLADTGLRSPQRARRRRLLTAFWTAQAVLCSGVVWLWWNVPGHGIGVLLGGNAYLLIALALLVGMPIRGRTGEPAVVSAGEAVDAVAGAGGGAAPAAVPEPVGVPARR